MTGRGSPWASSLVPDLTYAEPIIRYVPPPGGLTGGISGGGVSGGGVSAGALAIATGQSYPQVALSDADGMTMQMLATPPVFTLPPASQSASLPITATATDDSLPHLWAEARNVAQAKAPVDCLSDWTDLGSSIYH